MRRVHDSTVRDACRDAGSDPTPLRYCTRKARNVSATECMGCPRNPNGGRAPERERTVA